MAYVNFGRKNTREESLASENKDKVFFPTDATSIILGGKEYGVGDVKEEDLFEGGIPEGYVDLGLPSGKLWASCNLGASTETEYGNYYMWGSTTPNTNDVCDWAHASFNNGSSSFDSAYFNAHKDEWLDGDVLKPEYDAVYQATGGKAHMPTKEDFEELIANTDSIWTTIEGVNGRLFTSKTDSTKKIFIPASGYLDGSSFFSQGSSVNLWSSSLDASSPSDSWYLLFDSGFIVMYGNYRCCGFCVRGVCNPTLGGSKKIKPELLADKLDLIPRLNVTESSTGFKVETESPFGGNASQELDLNDNGMCRMMTKVVNESLIRTDPFQALMLSEDRNTQKLSSLKINPSGINALSYDENGQFVRSFNYNNSLVVTDNELNPVTSRISQIINDLIDLREDLNNLREQVNALEIVKSPNVTLFGNISAREGLLSQFGSDAYAQFPFVVDLRGKSWLLEFSVITLELPDGVLQNIFDSDFGLAFAFRGNKFVMAASTNGTSWDLGEKVSTIVWKPRVTAHIRIFSTNAAYDTIVAQVSTDKINWDTLFSFHDAISAPYPKPIRIGNSMDGTHPFSGIIDLNYAKLGINGAVFWQGMDSPGLSTRLATDLSNVDAAGEAKIKEIARTADTVDGATSNSKIVVDFSQDTLPDAPENPSDLYNYVFTIDGTEYYPINMTPLMSYVIIDLGKYFIMTFNNSVNNVFNPIVLERETGNLINASDMTTIVHSYELTQIYIIAGSPDAYPDFEEYLDYWATTMVCGSNINLHSYYSNNSELVITNYPGMIFCQIPVTKITILAISQLDLGFPYINDYETTIFFRIGNTAPEVEVISNMGQISDLNFEPNKSYVLVMKEGLVTYHELTVNE